MRKEGQKREVGVGGDFCLGPLALFLTSSLPCCGNWLNGRREKDREKQSWFAIIPTCFSDLQQHPSDPVLGGRVEGGCEGGGSTDNGICSPNLCRRDFSFQREFKSMPKKRGDKLLHVVVCCNPKLPPFLSLGE